jgi:hypothetical protein
VGLLSTVCDIFKKKETAARFQVCWRVPLPFESMSTSPLSMFGTSLILICPVKAISRSVLEIIVTVSQRVLS